MEKVILKLISELDFILYQVPIIGGSIGSCRIQVIEQNKEAITGAKENDENIRPTIETLDKELPNMLAYCKKISSCPAEIKLLIKLFEGVINKYGLTKEISYVRYHCAQLGEIVDDYAEIVSLEGTVTMELAESCKPWLYWLYKYYPKKEGDDAPRLKEMPRELDTEPARKYFARAVEAGLMEKNFKWTGTPAQLGYFCSKAYKQPRPINSLENFFNVKKLSSAITKAEISTPKRADVIEWRKKQDEEIFYD